MKDCIDTVFSGIQPSGGLHWGNYIGAVHHWVTLQSQYRCLFCIVDYHAITQAYEPKHFQAKILDMAADLLASGIDPNQSIFFIQSDVPEHTELCWILNSVTPFGDLSRMTQFKEKSQQHNASINAGLFGYPVLQAADIALYKANKIPVGQDQIQHVELVRRIVRIFNQRFGTLFPEPEPMLSQTPKILGLDGQAKMSKSMNNTIEFSANQDVVRKKIAAAATDPQRKRRNDTGNPEHCNIYTLHQFFSDKETIAWANHGCKTADIGCVDCKKALSTAALDHFSEIRMRKETWMVQPDNIKDILKTGAQKARVIAQETMNEVREKMGL